MRKFIYIMENQAHPNKPYIGATFSKGLGTPSVETHAGWGYTYSLYESNIYKDVDYIINKSLVR